MKDRFTKNSSYKIIQISDKPVAELKFDTYYDFELKEFDVIQRPDDSDIYELIKNNPQVDAIVLHSDDEKAIWENIFKLPYYYHRRCIRYSTYNNVGIDVALRINAMQLSHSCDPFVSIVTPLYNTNKKYFCWAYKSLCDQTLNDWEWVLVDDSPEVNKELLKTIEEFNDIRVKYYRIGPTQGNIGLSKWRGNCLAKGKWLLEFDHDDMLNYWTLQTLKEATEAYPENKFVFSDDATIDAHNKPNGPLYGNAGFGMGFGYTYWSNTPEKDYKIFTDCSPAINNATIRHIVGVPNHFRCWERNFYFAIGGHNQHTRIADDYELLVRTFLHTRMTHIPFCCYMQRFDDNNSQDSGNNRADIQRRVRLIAIYYDEAIHKRLEELGNDDSLWVKGDPYITGHKYSGNMNLKRLDDLYIPDWGVD